MKSTFLGEVVDALQTIPSEVLSIEDSKRIDSAVSKLPWRGQNIDWSSQQHQTIDLSEAGEYSLDSIPVDSLRRFLALQGGRVVVMFSAYEPPIAMAADDFVENWLLICSNLTFLLKIILVSASELSVENPRIVEVDPMQFIKGHV
jgi:hypothetical protein